MNELTILFSITGIVLNTLGVALIFIFGISPYLQRMGGGMVILYNTTELNDKNSKQNKKKRRNSVLSKLGLLLCVIGGFFQIFALLVPFLM